MKNLKTNWITGKKGNYHYEVRTDPDDRENGLIDFCGDGKITFLSLYRGYHQIALYRKGDWELLPIYTKTFEQDLDMLDEIITKFN